MMMTKEKTTQEKREEDILQRQKNGWYVCTSMDEADLPFEKQGKGDVLTFIGKQKKLFSMIPKDYIVLEIKSKGGISVIMNYLTNRCRVDFLTLSKYIVLTTLNSRHLYFKKDPNVVDLAGFKLTAKGVKLLTYPDRVPIPYQGQSYIQRGSPDSIEELPERVLRKLGDLQVSITDKEIQEILSIDQVSSVDRDVRLEEFCKAVARTTFSRDYSLALETALQWDEENEPPFGEDIIKTELQAFLKTEEKKSKFSRRDLKILMANDYLFQDAFYFDEMKERSAVNVNPFPECKLTDGRITNAWLAVVAYYMSDRHHIEVGIQEIRHCIDVLAQKRRVHPIKEKIQSFYRANQKKLEKAAIRVGTSSYQPESKIDNFFHIYCGLDLDPYLVDISRIMFSTLIGRTFKDRYKADHLVILRGVQGIFKSTMCQILAIKDEWFDNTFNIDGKTMELVEKTSGCLITEWQELQGYKSLKENKLKAVLSTTGQTARRAYDMVETYLKVGYMVLATTNASDFVYTPDTSRRLLPVLLTQPIDTEQLKNDIPFLYAEAYKRFLSNPVTSLRRKSMKLHELRTVECSGKDESLTKTLISWLTDKCLNTYKNIIKYNPEMGWYAGRRDALTTMLDITEILPDDLVKYYKVFDDVDGTHSYSELRAIVEYTLGALGYSPKVVKVRSVVSKDNTGIAIPNNIHHLGSTSMQTMYFLRGKKIDKLTEVDPDTGVRRLKKTEEALGSFIKLCTPEEEEGMFFDEMTKEQKVKFL